MIGAAAMGMCGTVAGATVQLKPADSKEGYVARLLLNGAGLHHSPAAS